jgi:hypothetical protein
MDQNPWKGGSGMKLPMKVAGICWSLTFLVTAIPGFYQQTRPTDFTTMSSQSFSGMAIFETLLVSMIGSLAAGMIGYIIGDILSNPQGKPKAAKEPSELKPQVIPEPKSDNEVADKLDEDPYPVSEQSDFEPVSEEESATS